MVLAIAYIAKAPTAILAAIISLEYDHVRLLESEDEQNKNHDSQTVELINSTYLLRVDHLFDRFLVEYAPEM